MLTPSLGFVLLAAAGIAECRSLLDVNHVHRRYKRQNQGATGLTLVANAVQSGSAADGTVGGVLTAGQSKSQVSQNNFINFCQGKTLTNGLQVQGGSCNGIPMGEIPSKQNMVSSIITFPLAGSATIQEKTDFSISVQMINFVAGSFTNAQLTYYSAPQALSGGKIVGHTHVTVQDMGPNLNPKQPLDATKFVFFKGINDPGNGNGLLSASVPGGLPAGNYRVCTMASASNHQLVLMPVAQRGAQDDCTKFTVVAAGQGNGGNTDNSVSSSAQATIKASTTSASLSTTSASTTSASLSTTSASISTSTSASLSTTSASTTSASLSTTSASLSTSTSAVQTSPAETNASETTQSSIETSISESLPILSSSQPPFTNTSFVAAKTTTSRRGGNGRPPKTRTTTKISVTTTKAAASSSTSLSTVVLSTTTKAAASSSTSLSAVVLSTTTKVSTASTRLTTTSSSLAAPSAAPPKVTTTRQAGNNGGGKGQGGGKNNNNNNIKVVKNKPIIKVIKVVHKVTIIRTFFTFKNSLGGLPPAVNKKGNLFAVLDQFFDSLTSACDAACGAQYKTCISFSGPGFEVTKCKQQRKDCGAAAQIVTSQPAETPKAITATVTVPPSASVPGQIVGEETVVSSVEVPASSVTVAGPQPTLVDDIEEEDQAAPIEQPTVVQEDQSAPIATNAPVFVPQATPAACTPITQTVTVDNTVFATPTSTSLPVAVISKPLFSNSTASATPTLPVVAEIQSSSASSLPTPTPSAQASVEAVAGIAAPIISASGDASRPFLVNGNTFANEAAAKQRSCDIQFNKCADAVNGGKAIGVVVGDCERQKVACSAK